MLGGLRPPRPPPKFSRFAPGSMSRSPENGRSREPTNKTRHFSQVRSCFSHGIRAVFSFVLFWGKTFGLISDDFRPHPTPPIVPKTGASQHVLGTMVGVGFRPRPKLTQKTRPDHCTQYWVWVWACGLMASICMGIPGPSLAPWATVAGHTVGA